MLLQSAPGQPAPGTARTADAAAGTAGPPGPVHLDVLPALPSAWPSGAVHGLAARGRIVVRCLEWAPGRVDAVLVSPVDQPVTVGLPGGAVIDLRLPAGRPTTVNATVDSLFG
jgi:alpha-L-fucosidase 2